MKSVSQKFDVVIVTDLRFPGGSSASTLEEININYGNGWRVGLYHLPAHHMVLPRPVHHGIANAILQGKCKLLNLDDGVHSTRLLLFRHPSTIDPRCDPLPSIKAEKVVLVINHPPKNIVDRVDYNLHQGLAALEAKYGMQPLAYPIGPRIREAIDEFYGGYIPLQPNDWVNVFDLDQFRCDRSTSPRPRIRIGRHSRPGAEKWPSDRDSLLAAYPVSDKMEIHVLGGARIAKSVIGYIPANWRVHEFGSVAPEEFLKQIDIFVYFHHPNWIEAFGRAIAEAMASGAPTILPHHFQPAFGDAVLYSKPEDVQSLVDKLRDSAFYSDRSRRAVEFVEQNFSPAVHTERVRKLIGTHG